MDSEPENSSKQLKSTPPPAEEVFAAPPTVPFGKKLKLYSVQLGSTVSKAVAATLVSAKLGTTIAIEAGEYAAITSAAQINSAGLVAMRLPLRGTRLAAFSEIVKDYAIANEHAVMQIAEMSVAQQAVLIGVKTNVLAAVATAAVQQGVAVALLASGSTNEAEFRQETVGIALAGAGTVVGGTAGAVAGSILFPGVGTAVGSLLGSYAGAFAPAIASSRQNDARQQEELATATDRPLKTVPAEGFEDWLEVVDCSMASMVAFRPRSEDGDAIDMCEDDTTEVPLGPDDPACDADSALFLWKVVDDDEDVDAAPA